MPADPFNESLSNSKGAGLDASLLTLRIIWLALIAGVVAFMVIVQTVVIPQHHQQQNQPSTRILILVNLLMFVTELPVMFVIRAVIFKRGRIGDGISCQAYSTGSIIFWAGCEGIVFFALVIGVIKGSLSPTIWIAAAALALMALTFPLAGKMVDPNLQ